MNKIVKGRALAVTVLILALLGSVLLASCDTGMSELGIDSIPDISKAEANVSGVGPEDIPTEPGHTEAPYVSNVINISPDVVVIAGTCEQGAVVTIKGGKEDVEVRSTNGYFITTTTLINKTVTLLEATAEVEGKEVSAARPLTAQYNPTAEPRLDGMSVSVGKDSHTYFEKMVDDYIGSNLLTQTKLRKFKSAVNSNVDGYVEKSNGQAVDIIYVLIPDSTSVNDEYLDPSVVRKTTTTRYEQISGALKETNAVLIDMYDVFAEASKTSEYPIYRASDSHMTEYGAYLTYNEIMKVISTRFEEAAPRGEDEFTFSTTNTIGGDLISYLGVDTSIVTENIPLVTPKFDLGIGNCAGDGITTTKISDVKVYNGKDDYSVDMTKSAGTILSRLYFRTERPQLPSAIIYRDDASANLIPMLAERFDNVMTPASGDFTINFTEASRHNSEGRKFVDYIIVIVNESNLDKLLPVK